MKQLFLTFLLFLSFYSFGQNITISELNSFLDKDIFLAEEILSSGEWYFTGMEETTDEDGITLKEVSFTYDYTQKNDWAQSYITIYLYKDKISMVTIQILEKERFNKYLNNVKSLGGKLIESKLTENVINRFYENGTTIFSFSIHTNNDIRNPAKNIYLLSLFKNKNFYYNYRQEQY